MPNSKRAKVVSLTKVAKKTKEQKGTLINEVQENSEKWRYCWIFSVGSMRNTHLKTVRTLWKDSARIFFGRCAVMAKALGTTPEEEHKLGLHKIAQQLHGQVGLLFTDSLPAEVADWFDDFVPAEFARAGNVATRTVILPSGPVLQRHSDPPGPLPHNEEPQLRKLGLHTTLVRGVPTLNAPHKICEEGKPLSAEQAQLLKLVGEKLATFKVHLKARWDGATGEVEVLDSSNPPAEGEKEDEKAEEDGDKEENEEDAVQ